MGPSYDGRVTKRYLVRTFGCQMNEHDSERIAGLLEADGYEPAGDESDADVIVLNTCCIREGADTKLYGTLGHLKSLKDARGAAGTDVEIMVAGCLAQKDREDLLERAPHVDVVLGTHNVGRATALLDQHRSSGIPVIEILESTVAADHDRFPSALPVVREEGWAAWVTIQVGCDNGCAFCIVPTVRGPEVSRSFGDVVAEVESAAADGVTEVTLLGQNVNSYGRDLTLAARGEVSDVMAPNQRAELAGRVGDLWLGEHARARPLFADLLRAVGEVPGIQRVRYTSPHPKDLRPETITAMAEVPAVCEHLHLPLQSGSDRILAAMHRGYTAERYLERLAAARAGIDDLAVSTDIIVGFPGETDEDFEATLEVAATARYDNAYTFVYSPRPGTEAAATDAPEVAHHVAVQRMSRLRAVVERSSRLGNEARIGLAEEVLVEGPSKRNPNRLTGRTRHNRLVHFVGDSTVRRGSYAEVEITSAATTHMLGELREVTRNPAHRTRIPVASL
jgi:tRNA-2-methylthio-N6-dimethylallyladenosine synthase